MLIAVIQGSGDIGSAVAHQLVLAGYRAIITDCYYPGHARRGMSFVNAYYEGTARLDGVVARYTNSIVADDSHEVLVNSHEVENLLVQLDVAVVIDARMRKRVVPELPAWKKNYKGLLIGLGPGFDPKTNCDVAIESAWGELMGSEVVRSTRPQEGDPKPINGLTRERMIYAPRTGTWNTRLDIGDLVQAEDILGDIDGFIVCSPMGGTLRGISHHGAHIKENQKIIEVDPSNKAQIIGLGERPKKIAQGVTSALKARI
jgi:xanthine dehydrogenase accessory factor